jgi:uncharacterized membrane protein
MRFRNILKSIWHAFISWFGQGLLYLLPIGLTIFILVIIFQKLDTVFEFDVPGLGVVTLIGLITFVGFLGSFLISSPIFNYFGRLINRAPLVKMLYNAIKDLLSVFVGNKKKFTEPVLVKLSKDFDLEQIGFITQTDLEELGICEDKISVYVPYSFSFMGTVYIVPKENVKILKAKPQDALKFVVSGGVSKTDDSSEEDKIKN